VSGHLQYIIDIIISSSISIAISTMMMLSLTLWLYCCVCTRYNHWRKFCGLPYAIHFGTGPGGLTSHSPENAKKLQSIYRYVTGRLLGNTCMLLPNLFSKVTLF